VKKRTTTYRIEWHGIRLVIRHQLDYPWLGQSHVEFYVVRPKQAAIPITATGYRSHFIGTIGLINAGGAVSFVTAWLDREASKSWITRELRESQGDLFAMPKCPQKATG
jgi:hypothetical protein